MTSSSEPNDLWRVPRVPRRRAHPDGKRRARCSVVRAEERSSGALAEDEIEIEPNESADPHVLARPLIDRHHGFDADLDPFPDPDRSEVRGTGRPTALAAIES